MALSPLNTLNPVYQYLPYCLVVHEEGEGKNKTVTYEYRKTYPAFPWRHGTGTHIDEDPEAFIEACVTAGLVHWETAEDTKERLRREAKYVDPDVMYEEWKAKREEEKVKRMESDYDE